MVSQKLTVCNCKGTISLAVAQLVRTRCPTNPGIFRFIPQSITYNRENHELLISAKDMEINQKPEDAVPFKDSLNSMTKGAARSIYLESGNKIVFRG